MAHALAIAGIAGISGVTGMLCGCGAHSGARPPSPDILRDAITPTSHAAPEGVLAPEKYVPPPPPAVAEPGLAKPRAHAEADTTSAAEGTGSVYADGPPEPVVRVAPSYPDSARAAGVSGLVLVQALVGVDGNVREVRVVRSIPLLDEAAKAAVKQWKFKPALSAGKPIEGWTDVPVRFSLH